MQQCEKCGQWFNNKRALAVHHSHCKKKGNYTLSVEELRERIRGIPTENVGETSDEWLKGWNACLKFTKQITGVTPVRFPKGASELYEFSSIF